LRFPHFLDSQLTDDSEVVSLTCQQPFTPERFLVLISVKRLNQPQGHSAAGRIWSLEKSSGLIGYQTPNLLACTRVPQPTSLLRACVLIYVERIENDNVL
jgi:hypothetical protein